MIGGCGHLIILANQRWSPWNPLLLTLSENMGSSPVFTGVSVVVLSIFWGFCRSLFIFMGFFFHFTIVLYVLRFITSLYLYGIFKLFFLCTFPENNESFPAYWTNLEYNHLEIMSLLKFVMNPWKSDIDKTSSHRSSPAYLEC